MLLTLGAAAAAGSTVSVIGFGLVAPPAITVALVQERFVAVDAAQFQPVPVGVPIFLAVALASGALHAIAGFSWAAIGYLAAAGILHFAWGRYCNYRATKAMGTTDPAKQDEMLALAKEIYK